MTMTWGEQPQAWALSPMDARHRTDEVKADARTLWTKLLELYEGGAHLALGYPSWGRYCAAEFEMGAAASYRLLRSARVIAELPIGNSPVNEAQARELVPLLKSTPAAVPVAWQEAQDAAASAERAVTAADVRQAVERHQAKPHAQGWAERRAAAAAQSAERVTRYAPDALPFDRIVQSDALTYLHALPEGCADLCVTSPPYWAKRTYSDDPDELGQGTPSDYSEALCRIVNAIGRVLAPTGWLFLNLGDTYANQPGQYRGDPERQRGISATARQYAGSAPVRSWDVPDKSLCLIPWRVLTTLVQREGWVCRNVIAWHKPNHQPENVGDRLTQAWEPIFALTRSQHPYWNSGDGKRDDLWTLPIGERHTVPHPAPFPRTLVHRAIVHACPPAPGGVVLDPFAGSGTTLEVARSEGRRFLGCDLIDWTAPADDERSTPS